MGDGTFTAVREIHILYGRVIVAFSVEYDNNGSPAQRPEHGNDRSYMVSRPDNLFSMYLVVIF